MKRKLFYALTVALCGLMGFTSCTKDYDDDLRVQRELIENNERELRALIDAYQVLVENTIEQIEIAYKNADDLIRQHMQAEFDAAKQRLTALEAALAAAEGNIAALQNDLAAFKAAVSVDFQRVNAHIDAINARIDNAEQRITALDGRLTTVEAAIADMKAWRTLAEAKLAELENGQQDNKTEIEALKTRIAAVEARITALEQQYAALELAMNKADDALNKRIDDLTAQLGVQETSLTALIASVQTSLTDKMNDFKARMTEAFDAYKTRMDEQFEGLALEVEALTANITDLNATINTMAGRVDDLERVYAEMVAKIAGLASAADLQALTGKVNDLTVSLAAKEAALLVLIGANKDEIAANKAEIAALREQIAAMKSDLEKKIADAVADKVTKTEMDAAIEAAVARLTADYQAADDALQALIDEINDTTIPAMQSRIDTIEAYITGLKNRIQALKWLPAYADGALTLAARQGAGAAYESAVLTEDIYIDSALAGISDLIFAPDSGYAVEVIANGVATRGIVINPFGAIQHVSSAPGVISIRLEYNDLTYLWDNFSSVPEHRPESIGVQLAVKITDKHGNSAMTDFADVVIDNTMN